MYKISTFAFPLPKINLIQHMLPTDLIQSQICQRHSFAGMIQQLHDQANVVVGLHVNAVGPGLAHRVRAKVIDPQQVPHLGHHVVELALIDMLLRARRGREKPLSRPLIAVALEPLLIHHQIHHDRF